MYWRFGAVLENAIQKVLSKPRREIGRERGARGEREIEGPLKGEGEWVRLAGLQIQMAGFEFRRRWSREFKL